MDWNCENVFLSKINITMTVMEVCIMCINLEKLAWRQNSECCSADFWPVLRACLEISRCCSDSILMKVSDVIIYIMKIMWRDFRKICSSCFRDIQKSAKSPNFEWICTHTGGEKTG